MSTEHIIECCCNCGRRNDGQAPFVVPGLCVRCCRLPPSSIHNHYNTATGEAIPVEPATKQENNICAICGGLLRVEYTIVFAEGRPHEIRVDTQKQEALSTSWHLCGGHPRPAMKHDGQLNEEDTHHVYYNYHHDVVVSAGGSSPSWLLPKEALSFRDWLIQETPTLEGLVREQEGLANEQ